MDDTEEEKVQLLESIRLQDAALSAIVDNSITTIDSDSDAEEGQPNDRNCGTLEIGLKDEGSSRTSDKPSWAEALEANQEYDAVLAQVEEEIKLNIIKIDNQVREVRSKIDSVTNISTGGVNSKGHWLYPFGMPYFKTATNFPCPFNEDYYTKTRNNEICWSDLPAFHQWVAHDKKALNNAVKTLSLQKCQEKAHYQLAVLQKELASAKAEGNDEKVANLEQTIESFDVSEVAQTMLQDVIENDEHDWMHISAQYLDGRQSSEMCRSFWHLYLHPKINKTPYTEEEEKKLVALAQKYRHQDWDRIALELGTNRSGYQCFIVYQNKLNSALKKNVWDPDEDLKLLKVVEKHSIGDYIPWGKIAYHMEGRTKTQIFNRWTYSLNPGIRKGRFTPEEDIMILVGVNMWGEDFSRISNFLKDRTTCQVRDRYKHYLNRPGAGIPWTIDDDELLLKLVDKYGRNWAKISEHFPTKNRTQVRHRYSTIAKWREKCPDAPLTEAPSRSFYPQQHKQFQEQWNKAQAILRCESVEEMVKTKNSIVSSLVRCKKKQMENARKKKPSVVETDLVNYFRCSYNMPGGHRKPRLLQGEAQKYAGELSMIFKMLKAELNFPSIPELHRDFSLPPLDKEILTALLLKEKETLEDSTFQFPPEFDTAEEAAKRRLRDDLAVLPSPLFCDTTPSDEVPETTKNIDYTPTHNLDTLYIDLPLMDFDKIRVVADKNPDPSFYNPTPVEESNSYEPIPPRPSTVREVVICPPNFTSLVGLRTFLLNRRNLVEWCNTDATPTDATPTDATPTKEFTEARQKFDERIFSLFLWPALMSRCGPSNNEIFLNDEIANTAPVQKKRLLTTTDKNVRNQVHVPSKPVEEQLQSTSANIGDSVEKGGSTYHENDPLSLPPKKRRKVVVEESDPDDPEAM